MNQQFFSTDTFENSIQTRSALTHLPAWLLHVTKLSVSHIDGSIYNLKYANR